MLDLGGHAREERRPTAGAAGRRVLDHDRNVHRVGQPRIELVDLRLGHAEGGAVVGRHHHHHRGTQVLRAAAALGADLGAEVRGGHDHRHAAGDVLEDGARQQLALVVREHELLGEIGEDADAVRAGIDHEIDAALLAREVELARFGEGGRHHRKDALVAASVGRAHAGLRESMRMARDRRAAAADEKVEIAALVGLQHVVDVEAAGSRRACSGGCCAAHGRAGARPARRR